MGIGYINNPYRGGYAMPLGPGYQNLAANQAAIQSLMGGLGALQAGAQQAQQQRAQAQLLQQLGSVQDRAGLAGVLQQAAASRQGGGGIGAILNSFNPMGSYGGMTPLETSLRTSLLGPLMEDPLQRQLRQERLTGAQLGNQAAQFGVGRLGADAAWQDTSRGRQQTQWGQADADRRRAQGFEDVDRTWQDTSRARQQTQWGQADADRRRAQGFEDVDRAWQDTSRARQQTQWGQTDADRTRQLGEHAEDRRALQWQRGRDMKRQGTQEALDDQQLSLNQQRLEAGRMGLDDAKKPKAAGPDWKRYDAYSKAQEKRKDELYGLVNDFPEGPNGEAKPKTNMSLADAKVADTLQKEIDQLAAARQAMIGLAFDDAGGMGPYTTALLHRYSFDSRGRLRVDMGGKSVKADEGHQRQFEQLIGADAAAAGVGWLDQLNDDDYQAVLEARTLGMDWATIQQRYQEAGIIQ